MKGRLETRLQVRRVAQSFQLPGRVIIRTLLQIGVDQILARVRKFVPDKFAVIARGKLDCRAGHWRARDNAWHRDVPDSSRKCAGESPPRDRSSRAKWNRTVPRPDARAHKMPPPRDHQERRCKLSPSLLPSDECATSNRLTS